MSGQWRCQLIYHISEKELDSTEEVLSQRVCERTRAPGASLTILALAGCSRSRVRFISPAQLSPAQRSSRAALTLASLSGQQWAPHMQTADIPFPVLNLSTMKGMRTQDHFQLRRNRIIRWQWWVLFFWYWDTRKSDKNCTNPPKYRSNGLKAG